MNNSVIKRNEHEGVLKLMGLKAVLGKGFFAQCATFENI